MVFSVTLTLLIHNKQQITHKPIRQYRDGRYTHMFRKEWNFIESSRLEDLPWLQWVLEYSSWVQEFFMMSWVWVRTPVNFLSVGFFGIFWSPSLLDDMDMELSWEKQNILWVCQTSRKKDRKNIDGTFLLYQKGPISTTFTIDWYLHKGENRDKMGTWLKKKTVRCQDQWRILQVNTHIFRSSHRTTVDTISQKWRSRTSVSSAEFCGCRKEGSTRRTIFLFKLY